MNDGTELLRLENTAAIGTLTEDGDTVCIVRTA